MINKFKSEEGSVVLLALMVLMLITVFGISALNTSDTELRVSHNSRCYKQNLYQAEGIVRATASTIDNTPVINLRPNTTAGVTPLWLNNAYQNDPGFDPETLTAAQWASTGTVLPSTIYGTGRYTVFYLGPSQGDSLIAGGPKLYEYAIYGKSSRCNGDVGVVAGFRMEF